MAIWQIDLRNSPFLDKAEDPASQGLVKNENPPADNTIRKEDIILPLNTMEHETNERKEQNTSCTIVPQPGNLNKHFL